MGDGHLAGAIFTVVLYIRYGAHGYGVAGVEKQRPLADTVTLAHMAVCAKATKCAHTFSHGIRSYT